MYQSRALFGKLSNYAAVHGLTASRVRYWLTHRHLGFLLACIGILLVSPSLWSGWVFDDYWHKTMFSGQWAQRVNDGSLFGMFSFMDGNPKSARLMKDVGLIPWWNFEEITMAFWRPFTELTHWFDYQLWPESPFLMHVHSLLWFGLAIWLVLKLYRKIIGPTWIAGLAALLFALDNTHMFPAGFIANRNTLIAGCLGMLAFLAYLRWSQDKWTPGLVLGPICYQLALFSKESALAIGAYLFAYVLLLEKNSWRRRLAAFLPYVILTFGWFAVYRHLGFGTQGLGVDMYIDPGRAPLLFLKELALRLPLLIAAQLSGPPAEVWGVVLTFWPHGKLLVGLALLVILGFIAFGLFPLLKRDTVSRFWLVGALLGLVPVCAAFPSSRTLFFAGIGFMGIVARFLGDWRMSSKRLAHALSLFLICIHLMISPLTLTVYSSGLVFAHHVIRNYASAMPYGEDISQKIVLLVNPPVELMGAYISQVRAAHGKSAPQKVVPLASGELPLTVRRIDTQSLEIESEQGLLETSFGKFLRGPSHPMQAGQRIELSDMSVEVLELVDNWQPSHVRFRFRVPLEDEGLVLLQWKEGEFIPYRPPAIGESMVLVTEFSDGFVMAELKKYRRKIFQM